jgi:DNA-binding winged helix-turn-helix (wHTH) protein/predicted ATPase
MPREVSFGRHRFDPPTGRLWSGKREVRLTPKAAAVLGALVARAGQPVTREELFASVWGDTVVSDAALASCIQELREALGDDAKQPRFIETRHRRGYRFVAPLSLSESEPPRRDSRPPPVLVGRERELGELRACLAHAVRGERQLVFLTGEPGIGKTTVIEAFLADAGASRPELRVGQGRCIDHYGAGEAYLPILEALTRLCREPGGADLVRLLRQHAPSWLVQMPSLLAAADVKTLQRQTSGVTRERMLRELAEAVEVVTAERPLVLWLEDLHWSDVSTLDWLAYVGRRPGSARLLLLGAYRSGEVLDRGHPLEAVKNELEMQGRCRELPLALLSKPAIGEYLARRFPSAGVAGLARLIHERTEGNPLFVVNIVADLVTRGVLVERDGRWEVAQAPDVIQVAIPDDVRGMIARQLARLSPDERRILEAASAAGAEFSAAAVAVAAGVAVEEADAGCAALVRRESFLAARGADEWPDGTVSGRYGFRHALYREVVYEQVSAGHQVELHRRIGARIETAFGDRAGEVAAELAMHFQRGRDVDRAIRHLHRAGETATRRSAHREAVGHLTRALELLGTLSDSPDRTRQEVAIQIALGPALMAIEGWGAPEVERAYARARELCERLGDPPELFQVLWGLWQFRASRAELGAARALGERLLVLAQGIGDSGAVMQAHHALWTSLFSLGELVAARDHVARGLALYDPDRHASMAVIYGHDAGVCGLSIGAWALELLGEPDQASRSAQDAMTLARSLDHPFSEIHALVFGALFHRLRGDWRTTRQLAEKAIGVARDRGFALLLARATTMRGWAMTQEGEIEDGITQMHEGIATIRMFGPNFLPYFLGSLADGHARAGRVAAALDAVTEALDVERHTGSLLYAAELHRLRGELLRRTGDAAAAESSLRTALEVARRQQARTLEQRAATSLRELLTD